VSLDGSEPKVHSARAWANGKVCGECGSPVWGDAGFCRIHYYERLRGGSAEILKIKMVVSEWVEMPDGVKMRTASNGGR
jgi:hypothetical protein